MSSSCGDSDSYILVKETIIITEAGANVTARKAGERNKAAIFKNCALIAWMK